MRASDLYRMTNEELVKAFKDHDNDIISELSLRLEWSLRAHAICREELIKWAGIGALEQDSLEATDKEIMENFEGMGADEIHKKIVGMVEEECNSVLEICRNCYWYTCEGEEINITARWDEKEGYCVKGEGESHIQKTKPLNSCGNWVDVDRPMNYARLIL